MSGQYPFGSTSLGPEAEAETCDAHYKDEGRACAWFTFNCEDQASSIANIPMCHSGVEQSPIDLNTNLAIPGDPGEIVFQGYDVSFDLLPTAVLRMQNLALQLDFDATGIITIICNPNGRSGECPNGRLGELEDSEENLVTPPKKRTYAEMPSITGGPLGSDDK